MNKPDIAKAQEGRLNKLLDKQISVGGVILTNREHIHTELKKGYIPTIQTVNDSNKKARQIIKFHRLRCQESGTPYIEQNCTYSGNITEQYFGNANTPIAKQILALQDEINAGYSTKVYWLECKKNNRVWHLKKMEYDYAVRIMEQA